MKKSILLTALVLLTITTATATHAQVYANVEETIVTNSLFEMNKELNVIVLNIGDLLDQVGESTDDSQGVIKALGEKLDMTEALKNRYENLMLIVQKQPGNLKMLNYNQAAQILKEARANLAEAKKLAEMPQN